MPFESGQRVTLRCAKRLSAFADCRGRFLKYMVVTVAVVMVIWSWWRFVFALANGIF